jgi:hypothetical protein
MKTWILSAEAEECRLLAVELADRPEEALLLCMASAFDDLHVQRSMNAARGVSQSSSATRHM